MTANIPVQSSIEGLVLTDTVGSLNLYTSESHVKHRSIIAENGSPISHFFPATAEFTEKDVFPLNGYFSDWNWFTSYEGTVIRMFYHNGAWKTSTRRRIDAHNSYWGSNTSFGEMFDVIFADISTNNFDKSLTYTFLICSNSHNRLVCKTNSTALYFTGTFTKDGVYNLDTRCEVTGIEQTIFDCEDDLRDAVAITDINISQGFIGYNNVTGEFAKIMSSDYSSKRNLRNNEPDLRCRYLQTLRDSTLHRSFRDHYDDHARLFRRLDGSLHGLIRDILHGNIKECDAEIMTEFGDSVKKTHKGIASWISSLNTNILWKPIIFRLKNCRKIRRDEDNVRAELLGKDI
jgi:hypothetical protein